MQFEPFALDCIRSQLGRNLEMIYPLFCFNYAEMQLTFYHLNDKFDRLRRVSILS